MPICTHGQCVWWLWRKKERDSGDWKVMKIQQHCWQNGKDIERQNVCNLRCFPKARLQLLDYNYKRSLIFHLYHLCQSTTHTTNFVFLWNCSTQNTGTKLFYLYTVVGCWMETFPKQLSMWVSRDDCTCLIYESCVRHVSHGFCMCVCFPNRKVILTTDEK